MTTVVIQEVKNYVTSNHDEWLAELSSQTSYNGLKITKRVSSLPVGIIAVFSRVNNNLEFYIKNDKPTASGSFKVVSFPKCNKIRFAFSVLKKEHRQDDTSVTCFHFEGSVHATLTQAAHVVQGERIKYRKWKSENQNVTAALVTEYMNMGDLNINLKKGVRFKAKELKEIASQSSEGVYELHTHPRKFAHGDLKPDNIFLHRNKDKTLTIKIGDLGGASTNSSSHTTRGSPLYASPEKLLAETKGDSWKDDIWSLGITFFQLAYKGMPATFRGCTTIELLLERMKRRSEIRGAEPATGTFSHLIWQMLDPNPDSRPSIETVCKTIDELPETAFTFPTPAGEMASHVRPRKDATTASPLSQHCPIRRTIQHGSCSFRASRSLVNNTLNC